MSNVVVVILFFEKENAMRGDHRGRQGTDHEGNFKQRNKQVIYF